jgi:hypothetical protein
MIRAAIASAAAAAVTDRRTAPPRVPAPCGNHL